MSQQTGAAPSQSFEKELLHLLRFSKLDEDNLQELVGIVVGLQSKGLNNIRVFPRGLPPVVDGLNVQATIDRTQLGNIITSVLSQTPRLTGVAIFPYGIVNPEIFQVNVALGNTVEAGNAAEAGV